MMRSLLIVALLALTAHAVADDRSLAFADDADVSLADDHPTERASGRVALAHAAARGTGAAADGGAHSDLAAASSTMLSSPRPRHAVSVQLATLETTGIALLGERDLDTRKLSVVLVIGARSAARGDYGSFTIGAGVELRRWIRRAMKGWYVGARTDLARTGVEDMVDGRELGRLTTWSLGATLGYRWNIWRGLELTPSLGLGVILEGGLDGRSPTTARGAGTMGLSAGWLF